MIVKICGIRTLEDALAAVDAGVDMLGFNFHRPSPRFIEPADCTALVQALHSARGSLPVLVGVFVNWPVETVKNTLDQCGLELAQLHGDETPEIVAALNGRGFKAIRPDGIDAARAGMGAYRGPGEFSTVPDILLDASTTGIYGGSGQTADWFMAATIADECRMLLAGGLHPGNLSEAITAVHPWGVDVASGVENAPGVKDAGKMKRFIELAKTAG